MLKRGYAPRVVTASGLDAGPIVLADLHSRGGDLGAVTRVLLRDEVKPVADQTSVLIGHDCAAVPIVVVLLSSILSPNLVQRGVDLAAEARARVGSALGGPIITPLATGAVLGRSYAVFEYHRPLPRTWLGWRFCKRRIVGSVLEWQLAVASVMVERAGGASDVARANYLACLERIAGLPSMVPAVRDGAAEGIRRLADGVWVPRHVIDHNDFWKGNLLLPKQSGSAWAFTLIDWPGANLDGYGVYDFVRFARSARLSPGEARRWLVRVAAALGCELRDTRGHLLASLGHLAGHLEHWPMERYVQSSVACVEYLESVLDAKA